jgi:hypothetical protein
MSNKNENHWIRVERGFYKRQKKKKKTETQNVSCPSPFCIDESKLKNRLNECCKEVENSKFFIDLVQRLTEIGKNLLNNSLESPIQGTLKQETFPSTNSLMHNATCTFHTIFCCYGLGTTEKLESLYQLALASLLVKHFEIPLRNTWVSDPVMVEVDFCLVRLAHLVPDIHYNANISKNIDQNFATRNMADVSQYEFKTASFISLSQEIQTVIKHAFEKKEKLLIFLYMPHCDQPVYGEILRFLHTLKSSSNSEGGCSWILTNCIIIGNDLMQYDEVHSKLFKRVDGLKKKMYAQAIETMKMYQKNLCLEYETEYFDPCPHAFSCTYVTTFKNPLVASLSEK